MSYIRTDSDVEDPRTGPVWRSERGTIHGTVYLRVGHAYITFDDPADARGVAAACTESAEAMERLAAEGKGSSDGD